MWDQGKDGALWAHPAGFLSCWQSRRVDSSSNSRGRGSKPCTYCLVSKQGCLCPRVSRDSPPSLPGTGRCPGLSWLARPHTADTTQNKTGVIPRLIATIVLKQGGGCVPERGRQMPRLFWRWRVCPCLYTQVHTHVQHSSRRALASAISSPTRPQKLNSDWCFDGKCDKWLHKPGSERKKKRCRGEHSKGFFFFFCLFFKVDFWDWLKKIHLNSTYLSRLGYTYEEREGRKASKERDCFPCYLAVTLE